MNDVFSGCHPAVNFLYFSLVIAFTMCLTHPACLAIALVCSAAYAIVLQGRKAFRQQLRWLLPVMLMAAILNPAFSHRGVTILAYLPSGNPLTLESILYGLAAGGMLGAVFLWFSCYNRVVTSDKFIYLFGRVIPALSLVLSMILRFVPRFKSQFQTVARAQKYMGRDAGGGKLLQKLKTAVKVFSIMVTWSLENAIETADSMRSRGYGEKGRTAFSLYRMDDRDRVLLLWLGFCGAYLLTGSLAGGVHFAYYPMLQGAAATPLNISFFAVYGLLCLTPVFLQGASVRQWKLRRREGHIRE